MSPIPQTSFLVWTFFAVSYSKLALVDVMRGQLIKLIHVVTFSELQGSWWNDLVFFKIILSHFVRALKPQKLTASKSILPKRDKKHHFLPNKEGSVVMQVQNASDLLLVFVGLFGVLWDVALRRLLYWTLLLEGKLGVWAEIKKKCLILVSSYVNCPAHYKFW